MSCITRTNVLTCRRDVSTCRMYSVSSGENFKRFKILVRVFMSYACRVDVVEVSHKTRTGIVYMSPLLVASRGVKTRATWYEFVYEFWRHEYDVCATGVRCLRDMYAKCYELPRQTTRYVRLCTSSVRLTHDIAPSSGEFSCCTLSKICSLQFCDLKSHGFTNRRGKGR